MTLEYDDRDRESVLSDLTGEDEEVRRLAVERVSVLSIEEAVPHLVERIGDTSWRVRKSAVERLVACPAHESVVAALVAALGDGENTGRRNSGVEALVECGGAAVPQLLAAMTSDDSDVRKLVVDALAGIGDERSISSNSSLSVNATSEVIPPSRHGAPSRAASTGAMFMRA